ncbi:hypothetical protein [Raoultella ornithinolytica]|uniref:hypothetical protein n=1 Tax=Raoultella ornithinolytica TaxID=54291 RepID=UPI00366D2588
MRLTVLDDDPGERIEPGRERITVYLDGVEVKHVFSADSDKGEVIAPCLIAGVTSLPRTARLSARLCSVM